MVIKFSGHYLYNLDSKGRVSIPSKLREVISERYTPDRLIITTDFDKCLVAYPLEKWAEIEEKIESLPTMKREVKVFMRHFISAATECELDSQGRILIPPALREYAGLNKEVYIIGLTFKIEIWDRGEWEKLSSREELEKSEGILADLGVPI
ncbi:MAG: division/cell wall cluster transcriptional repressor MraZ [Nitrospirota bacterium]